MRNVTFSFPPTNVDHMRSQVGRMTGLVQGQVTSCVLDGPPLTCRLSAVVPEERVARVLEVAGLAQVPVEVS